ncbi:MAG: D-aminoacyl-tRNA deacylase [Clostridia bacterium]|nr:D-aminoacyl-tRNA deacylase [Clostridia bacterium]
MIAIISRVSSATLTVEGEVISSIGKGLLIYVCAEKGDTDADTARLAHKCAGLRIFEDENGKMNLDSASVGGEFLVVSNFTLAGELGSGFRPSFIKSEDPIPAKKAVDAFAEKIRSRGHHVEQGIFGADMKIQNVADGPITLYVRSRGGKLLPLD